MILYVGTAGGTWSEIGYTPQLRPTPFSGCHLTESRRVLPTFWMTASRQGWYIALKTAIRDLIGFISRRNWVSEPVVSMSLL